MPANLGRRLARIWIPGLIALVLLALLVQQTRTYPGRASGVPRPGVAASQLGEIGLFAVLTVMIVLTVRVLWPRRRPKANTRHDLGGVAPSRGIETLMNCFRNDVLDPETHLRQAIGELRAERDAGAAALAHLIDDLAASRSRNILWALAAAEEITPTTELTRSLRACRNTSPTTPGRGGRFPPEIQGDRVIGWTDGTAAKISELTEFASGTAAPPVPAPPAGSTTRQGWSREQDGLEKMVRAFAAREEHLSNVKDRVRSLGHDASPVLHHLLQSDLHGPIGLAAVQSASALDSAAGMPLIAIALTSNHDSVRNVSIGYLEDHSAEGKAIAGSRLEAEKRADFRARLEHLSR